jgi:hypothetical protein
MGLAPPRAGHPGCYRLFLLLPLQPYNGYKLLGIVSGEERQAIGQLQKTLTSIQAAQNEEAFRAAVSQIPGAPTSLGRLTIPLPQAKERILEQLGGQIRKMDNQAEDRNASRWQTSLIGWARNCLLSLCYGAGFAEIARFPKARTSLLFSILRFLPWNRRMRSALRY